MREPSLALFGRVQLICWALDRPIAGLSPSKLPVHDLEATRYVLLRPIAAGQQSPIDPVLGQSFWRSP
jgi:hypothetical protein